jgi:ribosomal protein L34
LSNKKKIFKNVEILRKNCELTLERKKFIIKNMSITCRPKKKKRKRTQRKILKRRRKKRRWRLTV